MAEVKHTPGWRWERSGCRVYSEEFHRGRPVKVADVSVATLTEDELNFRGRLIAAAPDLFEALQNLATDCSQVWSADEFPALKAAFAALSKATTQQEGR